MGAPAFMRGKERFSAPGNIATKISPAFRPLYTLLVQIPDVDVPFPGFLVAFPVNDVLHWNDWATRQGERGAADLYYGIPCHFRRDGGEGCIRDVEAPHHEAKKLLMPGRPWIISAPGGKMWASGVKIGRGHSYRAA